MENQRNHLTDGVSNGTHLSGLPLTTEIADIAAPGLLTNAIDKAVVKIRPMAIRNRGKCRWSCRYIWTIGHICRPPFRRR